MEENKISGKKVRRKTKHFYMCVYKIYVGHMDYMRYFRIIKFYSSRIEYNRVTHILVIKYKFSDDPKCLSIAI